MIAVTLSEEISFDDSAGDSSLQETATATCRQQRTRGGAEETDQETRPYSSPRHQPSSRDIPGELNADGDEAEEQRLLLCVPARP